MTTATATREYITVTEMAVVLGVNRQTMRRYLQKDGLSIFRFGKTYRVSLEDWEAFKARNSS